MIILYVLLANFITLICVGGLFCLLISKKDKIRKWLYHKKNMKRKESKNERIR